MTSAVDGNILVITFLVTIIIFGRRRGYDGEERSIQGRAKCQYVVQWDEGRMAFRHRSGAVAEETGKKVGLATQSPYR